MDGQIGISKRHTGDFPVGSDGKESACNEGDLSLISGSGRAPGEGNHCPLQHSGWRIPWTEEPGGLQSQRVVTRGHKELDTTE